MVKIQVGIVKFFDKKGRLDLSAVEVIKSVRDAVIMAVATGIYEGVRAYIDYLSIGALDFDMTKIMLAFCVGFLGALANRFANFARIK